ncbi:transglycosylase domain-containing protein [Actinokineospora sp. NBRC 105648]|uniref:transglycosylase domain-containing protein n=1 Tax=Actinokineospora sp. NBRC 105648 TaxID=3032206 RepID=UPI0024A0DAA6|nr:transglycosylase domain-containing protein [Actinokineospora sp. NBRC 105648]GLZ37446.1 hypothetical protein Acsp05_10710 [Actinokineospora sp. NBRC 105648]
MNDHDDQRRRQEPEWPTGDDPDAGKARAGQQQSGEERTGFWSPLWEDEGDGPAGDGGPAGPSGRGGSGGAGSGAGTPGGATRAPHGGPDGGAPRGPGGPGGGRGPGSGPAGGPGAAPRGPGGPGPVGATGGPGGPGGRPGGPGGPGIGAAGGPGGPGVGGPGGIGNGGPGPGNGNGRGPGGPNGGPGRGPGDQGGPVQGGPGGTRRGPNGGPPRGPGGPGGPNGPGGPGGRGPGGAPGLAMGPGGPNGPRQAPPGATTALPVPGRGGDQTTVALPPAGKPVRPQVPEDPTVFMHKTPGQARSEPELLTHREPEFDDYEEPVASGAQGTGDDDTGPTEEESKTMRRKKIWRRVRRTCYVLLILAIIGPVLAFFITYQLVDVDNPADVARDQDKVVTLLYANGDEMAKIADAGANRVLLNPEDIPDDIKHAVYAAEDQSFETNAGFDISGILRATWNQVTGGEGGGSTISQQYIKKASGDEDPTLRRKWVEVVKSYKMNKTYDKKYIITAYLNTIYFGRGAYGIAAAAKAYYNIDDLHQVTKSQAALLAGMIQSPARSKDLPYQQGRWEFVTNRMIANKWMVEADRGQFPAPVALETTKPVSLNGPRAKFPELVQDELTKLGYSEEKVKKNGYRITTTIDPRAQQLAEEAVKSGMDGQPENLQPGLVAVDPKNGAILAYYSGRDGNGIDWAGAPQEPGSSFKPFDLVGLLKEGKGLGETYDSSDITGSNGGPRVKNAGKTTCGVQCPVAQAMKESLNTVFVRMVVKDVHPPQVAEAAKEAGVASDLSKAALDSNIAIGGGNTRVSTLDMATAYATFASGGVRRPAHIIAKIQYPDGATVWEAGAEPTYQETLAFTPNDPDQNQKIARNVTEALLPIPKYSHVECANNRLCAGKTGTHQYTDRTGTETNDNAKAWMVGYTPQISTAVSLSGEKGAPVRDAGGKPISGANGPGRIWQKFMNSYLQGAPKETFGRFVPIGRAEPSIAPSSSVRPTTPPSNPAPTSESPPPVTTTTTTPEDTPTTTTTTGKPTKTRPTATGTDIPLPGQGG